MTVTLNDILEDYTLKDNPNGYVHPDNRPRPQDIAKGLRYNDDSLGGSLLNDMLGAKEDMALCKFADKLIANDPKAVYDLISLLYNMDKRFNEIQNPPAKPSWLKRFFDSFMGSDIADDDEMFLTFPSETPAPATVKVVKCQNNDDCKNNDYACDYCTGFVNGVNMNDPDYQPTAQELEVELDSAHQVIEAKNKTIASQEDVIKMYKAKAKDADCQTDLEANYGEQPTIGTYNEGLAILEQINRQANSTALDKLFGLRINVSPDVFETLQFHNMMSPNQQYNKMPIVVWDIAPKGYVLVTPPYINVRRSFGTLQEVGENGKLDYVSIIDSMLNKVAQQSRRANADIITIKVSNKVFNLMKASQELTYKHNYWSSFYNGMPIVVCDDVPDDYISLTLND